MEIEIHFEVEDEDRSVGIFFPTFRAWDIHGKGGHAVEIDEYSADLKRTSFLWYDIEGHLVAADVKVARIPNRRLIQKLLHTFATSCIE